MRRDIERRSSCSKFRFHSVAISDRCGDKRVDFEPQSNEEFLIQITLGRGFICVLFRIFKQKIALAQKEVFARSSTQIVSLLRIV